MIQELRNRIDREEFDYQTLMDALGAYASPRDRVTNLLRKGVIIRVKKGLYIFGEAYRRSPYCRELLANLVHGPSMVSLQYALAFHGLIPERVESVTSVTTGRAKQFETPVGRFLYRPTVTLSVGGYLAGSTDAQFFIAGPERALADCLRADRGLSAHTQKELEAYLFEDLRIEPGDLQNLDASLLSELATALRSRKIERCAAFIRKKGVQG